VIYSDFESPRDVVVAINRFNALRIEPHVEPVQPVVRRGLHADASLCVPHVNAQGLGVAGLTESIERPPCLRRRHRRGSGEHEQRDDEALHVRCGGGVGRRAATTPLTGVGVTQSGVVVATATDGCASRAAGASTDARRPGRAPAREMIVAPSPTVAAAHVSAKAITRAMDWAAGQGVATAATSHNPRKNATPITRERSAVLRSLNPRRLLTHSTRDSCSVTAP
jgi:hypothetical protein